MEKMMKMEQIVQEGYTSLLKKGDIREVKAFYEITGIKPTEEAVQKAYETLLTTNLITAKKVQEYTGIKPSRELLLKVWDVVLETAQRVEIASLGMKPGMNSIFDLYGQFRNYV